MHPISIFEDDIENTGMAMLKKFIINDEIVFDPQGHTLTKMGEPVEIITLNIPTSRCLNVLLTKKGLVTHQELYEKGWSESPQEPLPNTLYQNILLIRQAFRKLSTSGIDFIVTVPRKGFYFNDKVELVATEENEPITNSGSSSVEDRVSHAPQSIGIDSLEKKIHKPSFYNVFILPLWVNLVLLVTSIFFLASFFYKNFYKQYDYDFEKNYTFINDIQECSIFIDSISLKVNKGIIDDNYLNRLIDKSHSYDSLTSCHNYPVRYVSVYHSPTRVIMIACAQRKNNNISKRCTNIYIRGM